MKKQILNKFSAFIIIAMLVSASVNAQIVYTDVIPDTSMICPSSPCSKSYNLDLNNDGILDFTLYTSNNFFTCQFQITSSIKSVSIACPSGNLASDNMLLATSSIGSSLSFTTNSVILRRVATGGGPRCPTSTTTGKWISSSDYYLGLQFSVGSNTYYGWVRLNVVVDQFVSTVSCKIKDYAYNSIPNQPIIAGQTGTTGIDENSFASSINLFPNPATNHLTIALGNNNKKVEVTITDLTGKIIYAETTNEANKIEVNTTEFEEGIYTVKIQSGNFTGTKKLVVVK